MRHLKTVLAAGAAAFLAAAPASAQNTLFVLGDSIPASLDTDGPAGTHTPTQAGIVNLMEPLVNYGIGGKTADGANLFDYSKFVPALAESWNFDAATNTWTMKLRQDVKSCAGNMLTADDILYTFGRAKSISGQAPIGYFLSSVGSIKGFTPALFAKTPEALEARKLGDEVTKLDDRTVQFKLTAPNQLFLPVLSIFALLIYDSVEMKAHATAEDPWSHIFANTTNGPSFGAYCLESWKKDDEFIVRANPNYYGPRPYFDRVIYRKVPQSANRVAILRAGRAQVAEALNPKELDSLKNLPGISVVGGYLNASLSVLANFKSKPFDNIKLRQALAYAVPYQDIVRSAYFGQAKQWTGLMPSSYPGFITPAQSYSYDPEKAKQMLAEAGYPEGRGLEAFPESFKLAYVAERESILGPAATLIQTRMKAMGIPVQLDPLPATQYADRQLVKKDLPFGLTDQSKPIGVDPVYAMRLSYMTPPQGVSNQTNFSDPAFDKLGQSVLIETDPAKRTEQLDVMQNILAEKLALIPIVENKLLYAMDSKISGMVLHPSQILVWKYLTR
jgi:peptide/nickel transport system substrate-binding protein